MLYDGTRVLFRDRPKFDAVRIKVEICATSFAEAQAAMEYGCDSVELCTWLTSGGVTPSNGLVQHVIDQLSIPTRVLIRTVTGRSNYSSDENAQLLKEVEHVVLIPGLRGIVVGSLGMDGLPEIDLMDKVKERCNNMEITFHRAIDHAIDHEKAMKICIDGGIERVLTSGGARTATDGIKTIKSMVEQAGSAIKIAAAAGINASNVVELVERTGVDEVHFSAQRFGPTGKSGVSLSSTGMSGMVALPDKTKIEGVLNALVKAGLR